MKRRAASGLGLVALAVAVLPPLSVRAVTGLELADSVRSQAMAGAVVGLDGDPTLLWQNPAAATSLEAPVVSAGGGRTFAGANVWQALGATPLGNRRLALAVTGYTFGDVTLHAADGSDRRVAGRQDLAGLVNMTIPMGGSIVAGISGKGLSSRLLEESTSGAMLVDAGVSAEVGGGVSAGLAVLNLGTALHYLEDLIPFSPVARAGATRVWRLPPVANGVIVTAVGADYRPADRVAIGRAGVECQWAGLIAVRAGYHRGSRREIGEGALGLGVRLRGIRLDYGILIGGPFASPMSASLTFFTGKPRAPEVEDLAPVAAEPPPVAETAPVPAPAAAVPFQPAPAPAAPRPEDGPIFFYPDREPAVRIPVRLEAPCDLGAMLADGEGHVLDTVMPSRRVPAGLETVEWNGTFSGAPVIRERAYILRITAGSRTLDYTIIVRDR